MSAEIKVKSIWDNIDRTREKVEGIKIDRTQREAMKDSFKSKTGD